MSSPIPPSSVNNSQILNAETPNTTPPAPPSQPDFEMDINEQIGTSGPTHTEPTNTERDADISMADAQKEGTAEEDEFDDTFDETANTLTLPIAKIKRIFKLDPDYISASQSAVYATGLATELFVQYLAEQASLLARMDKRKKVQYKDFSSAVAGHDALTFLSDTIPKTQPIGDLIQQKKVNLGQDNYVEIEEEEEAVVREIPN